MLRGVVGAMQVKQFGIVGECLEAMGEPGRDQQAATIASLQVLGMPMQESVGIGT
ncbi:hypothetical protein D3C75_1271870 [compost metagenome]